MPPRSADTAGAQEQSDDAERASARDLLMRVTLGAIPARLVYAAARLGIADSLASGAAGALDLAAVAGADPDAVGRLLRALASLGILREEADGRFSLAPAGQALRVDSTDSMRDWVLFMNETAYTAWADCVHTLSAGEGAFERVRGEPLYDYLGRNADARAAFQRGLSAVSRDIHRPIIDSCAASTPAGLFVDVGGGDGALLFGILERYPDASGVLFDRAEALAAARDAASRFGGRCRLQSGDFFRAVPEGGDIYLLKFVLHDWGDEAAVAILRNCRAAMVAGGRILIVQGLLPEAIESSPLFLWDMHMLVMTGGRERTLAEYRGLLERAGLRLQRVVPAATGMSVLEAVAG